MKFKLDDEERKQRMVGRGLYTSPKPAPAKTTFHFTVYKRTSLDQSQHPVTIPESNHSTSNILNTSIYYPPLPIYKVPLIPLNSPLTLSPTLKLSPAALCAHSTTSCTFLPLLIPTATAPQNVSPIPFTLTTSSGFKTLSGLNRRTYNPPTSVLLFGFMLRART